MSFWSGVKDFIIKIGDEAKEFNDEVDTHIEHLSGYDDEQLKRIVKTRYGAEKTAAAKLLRERGYGKRNYDDE